MKKINMILIFAIVVAMIAPSCLKEDIVSDPTIQEVQLYMTDVNGKDSLITEVFAGEEIKIVVVTDADIVSLWPGDVRQIMKKHDNSADSIDEVGNPVLIKSNLYEDYGLVMAQGLKTSLIEQGWYANYTYSNPGDFNLTIIATNHGYDSYDLHRSIGNVVINVK